MIWRVHIQSSVYFGSRIKEDHELLLTAPNEEKAQKLGRWFFLNRGGWTRAYHSGQGLMSEPFIRKVEAVEVTDFIVYDVRITTDQELPREALELISE